MGPRGFGEDPGVCGGGIQLFGGTEQFAGGWQGFGVTREFEVTQVSEIVLGVFWELQRVLASTQVCPPADAPSRGAPGLLLLPGGAAAGLGVQQCTGA